MSRKLVLVLLASLTLAACGTQLTRMDPKTEPVTVDYPDGQSAKLRLEVGVGSLKVTPGSDKLVTGTITYNVKEWTPQTDRQGDNVTLKQNNTSGFNTTGLFDVKNDWVLALGTARPYDLTIANGVAKADLTLGGLPLTGVQIEGGVGDATVNFASPNPQTAENLQIKGGVGAVTANGLLNANAKNVTVESGTGEIRLEFTGESLKQDIAVKVTTGVGAMTINVQKGIPVRVTASQGLGRVTGKGDFMLAGDNVYATSGFDTASGPKISIDVHSGVGAISLNTVEQSGSGTAQ